MTQKKYLVQPRLFSHNILHIGSILHNIICKSRSVWILFLMFLNSTLYIVQYVKRNFYYK